MAIRDPDAVVPLVRVFGQDDSPRRILLALVLSTIGGPEATAALIQRVLDESDSEVRSITFEHLKQREDSGVDRPLRPGPGARGHQGDQPGRLGSWAISTPRNPSPTWSAC